MTDTLNEDTLIKMMTEIRNLTPRSTGGEAMLGDGLTCLDCADRLAEAFARHRQAAFNAGLERAAELVVGYIHPDPDRLPGELFASAAIRAEKDKPQ